MPPNSSIPTKKTEGLGYAVAAGLMLIVAGGLIYWKGSRDSPSPAVVKGADPPAAATMLEEPPPPPPPPEVADAAPTRQPSRPEPAMARGGCDECAGKPSGALAGALQGKAGQARGCYERALRGNPGLKGRIVVGAKVGSDGHVCSASIAQSTLLDASVSTCVLQMFRAGLFPPPKGGCVEVEVPINFVPQP